MLSREFRNLGITGLLLSVALVFVILLPPSGDAAYDVTSDMNDGIDISGSSSGSISGSISGSKATDPDATEPPGRDAVIKRDLPHSSDAAEATEVALVSPAQQAAQARSAYVRSSTSLEPELPQSAGQPEAASHELPVLVRPAPELSFNAYARWLQEEATENQIPGIAYAIVTGSDILDIQTWGVRNLEHGDAVDPDTVFRIASVSKTFAGTVASLLVDSQIHSWDEPIVQLLPQYMLGTEPSSQQITLKHILSHSTGLMPHAYSNMLDAGVSYRKIQEKFHEIPTVCPPGRCYGYQNVVFSLISDVVELSMNTSYEDYVQQNIFLPLGMQTASLGMEAYAGGMNISAPHQYARGDWRVSTVNPAYFTVGPASGVNASIMDMSRWAQANLGAFPEVLTPTVLQMQHNPVVATPHGSYFNRWPRVENAWYGLGWRVFDYAGLRVVHHGGGVRGFRSEMVLIPSMDLAMVVLFNAATAVANDVVPTFLDTVLAQLD